MEKILISENEELKELISNISKNNQIRFFMFSGFILLGLLFKLTDIGIPWMVIEIIFLLLFMNILCECLTKNLWFKQTVKQVSLGYFILQIIEIIFLLILISYFDAVLFGGIAALMLYSLFCYLGFTRIIYPRIITLFCVIGYIIMGLLEHFGITEYHDFYNSGANLNQNRPLFIVTISFMVGFFIFSALYGDVFLKKLRGIIKILRFRTSQLTKKEKEVSEAKAVLEVKVETRTRELRELAKSLDEQVQQRTEELQGKVKDLERFQKLAVGRELKMVELKKEIERLERGLKKQ